MTDKSCTPSSPNPFSHKGRSAERFSKNRGAANPYYVNSLADRYSEFGLGPERADTMVRLGSVAETAMPISLHSDMPMAPADLLFLAWCAATRKTVSDRVAAPEQKISRDRALSAITLESAYVIEMEDELGSIKPGKVANFTILEQDPYAVEVDALKDIPVWGVVPENFPCQPQNLSPLKPRELIKGELAPLTHQR